MRKEKGFTLIELLVVVAIIGILAGIAIPMYVGSIRKAQRSEAYSNLQNLRLLEEQFFAENGTYVAGNSTAALQAAMPGFKPGSSLMYSYAITTVTGLGLSTPVPIPYAGATAALAPATTPCFIATATGIAGTRLAGDIYAIDCSNNRNF
jgi:type IV pilus assembly protein PilE